MELESQSNLRCNTTKELNEAKMINQTKNLGRTEVFAFMT